MAVAEFFTTPDEWLWWEREVLADVAGPVLDLGCGAGRHSLHLQSRGLAVTAVDHSPGAVEVCRSRGVSDVRLADLVDPPDDKAWGTVLLLCGNLGLAGGWDSTRRLLSRLAQICAPDARVVADTVDPTVTDDPDRLADLERRRKLGEPIAVYRLRLRYRDLVTPWWDLLTVPRADMARLVQGTGWSIERHLEDGADHVVVLRPTPR